ncbi:MAG TPA: hypothetical protein VL742_04785 [Casimicrobiaceae bacterium]|nr:hypothetical protein [Casimicrobiaceae bacterium]
MLQEERSAVRSCLVRKARRAAGSVYPATQVSQQACPAAAVFLRREVRAQRREIDFEDLEEHARQRPVTAARLELADQAVLIDGSRFGLRPRRL